jgi:hypothetical protein
VIVAV